MNIRVAFGAEVHGGWAAEEATVVDAESVALRGFASMLFRHIQKFRILAIRSDIWEEETNLQTTKNQNMRNVKKILILLSLSFLSFLIFSATKQIRNWKRKRERERERELLFEKFWERSERLILEKREDRKRREFEKFSGQNCHLVCVVRVNCSDQLSLIYWIQNTK